MSSQLRAAELPVAQEAACECLSWLALTTEVKVEMLHTGAVVDALLEVLYQIEGRAECEPLRKAAAKTLYHVSTMRNPAETDGWLQCYFNARCPCVR
eukprot:scaffold157016_cov42-Prasinocladus_malaysianus.AAC.1